MTGNPFAADIFPDGVPPESGAQVLHADAAGALERLVEDCGRRQQSESGIEGGGTVVLLRAPRAGFGKSHLLGRLQVQTGGRAEVVPIRFDPESELKWTHLLWQTVELFHTRRSGDVTSLDFLARRVFAAANQYMIRHHRLPCPHPEETLAALEENFMELFDFSDASQPVAKWFAENFERLLPFSAHALGVMAGLGPEASAHWMRVLCGYAMGLADGDAVRWETLRWSVLEPSAPALIRGGVTMVSAGPEGEAAARGRLVEFCRIAAGVRPLVLVFDHLDLFFQQTAAVQRIAGFLTELRRLVSRAVLVLSVNHDLWTQTFLKALPSALEDRLTGRQITLGGINCSGGTTLIRSRLQHAGLTDTAAAAFMAKLNLAAWFAEEASRLVSPRAVLRYAARVWDETEKLAAEERAARSAAMHNGAQPPALVVSDAALYRQAPPAARPAPARTETAPPSVHDPSIHGMAQTSGRRQMIPDVSEERPAGAGTTARPAIPAVIGRFQQLRTHFLNAPWLPVDHDRLFHLLKVTGQRLAVVRWVDHVVDGADGAAAGAWLAPDGEIVFGSDPSEDRTYWSALVDFVRRRSGHGGPRAAAVPNGCRLIVFSSVLAPVNLAAWMPPDEIIEARTRFLDIQPVDQPALALLYAAGETLRDAERGSLGCNIDEAFATLAPHIEFLWKRVTRPLAPAAGV